jgi:hypothetical protein
MAIKGLYDGMQNVALGMNESVHPSLVGNTECQRGVNVDISHNSYARTRPGFIELSIWTNLRPFAINGELTDPMTYFRNGRHQGTAHYKHNETSYLVIISGQLVWRINLSTLELGLYGWKENWEDIPKVNLTTPNCWFCHAEEFLIIQDGINTPFIVSGRNIRRSAGASTEQLMRATSKELKQTGIGEVNVTITEEGAVVPVNPTYETESTRVIVEMEDMLEDVSLNDLCAVFFRDTDIVEVGEITKIITKDGDDNPVNKYEIRFDVNRDWTKYGMKRYDNLPGTTEIHHGMTAISKWIPPEVPCGTAMAYGHGRLFVVREDKYIVAGDISLPWKNDSLLKFTETYDMSLGGALGLPSTMGNINALAFIQNIMTGTGQGALAAFCDDGVSAFAVNEPRNTWLDTNISSVVFLSHGGLGADAVCHMNSDIAYMAQDGVRSLKQTATISTTGDLTYDTSALTWRAKTTLDESAPWAWNKTSMVFDDNNLYFLTKASRGIAEATIPNKQWSNKAGIEEIRFKGMVATVSVQEQRQLLINSIWTGYDFLKLTKAETPLITARDNNNYLTILTLGNVMGNDADKTRTVSRLYTGEYDFYPIVSLTAGSNLAEVLQVKSVLKRIEYADFWISDIRGKATLTLYGRPSGYSGWIKCGSFTVEAGEPDTLRKNSWAQFRRKQRITIPRMNCDKSSGLELMTSSGSQFCIEIEGGMQLDRMLVFATLLPDETNHACREPQGRLLSDTGFNDYDYIVRKQE